MARTVGLKMVSINPALKYGLIVFAVSRLFLILWAGLVSTLRPIPEKPDEVLRPYLGEPILSEGFSGLLLGPWQRFDTQHYVRIAQIGYENEEDSVFPPLYPLAVRGVAWLMPAPVSPNVRYLAAAVMVSNAAFLGALILLFHITAEEIDLPSAKRAIIYFAIFPTAFFLLAAYSESIFIIFAMSAIWLARRGKFWLAAIPSLLAPLTRLTGWVLAIPLFYAYLEQREFNLRRIKPDILAVFAPLLGGGIFLGWRSWLGLPPIADIYSEYWYQRTGVPGADLAAAVSKMIAGEAPITLFLDFLVVFLLLAMTILTFRKLNNSYALFCAMLLVFMLLPTSELKPLYSFTRYALAFFPMFIIFGQAGENPWINRAIVYPSIALFLYLSGQFFMWGWVA